MYKSDYRGRRKVMMTDSRIFLVKLCQDQRGSSGDYVGNRSRFLLQGLESMLCVCDSRNVVATLILSERKRILHPRTRRGLQNSGRFTDFSESLAAPRQRERESSSFTLQIFLDIFHCRSLAECLLILPEISAAIKDTNATRRAGESRRSHPSRVAVGTGDAESEKFLDKSVGGSCKFAYACTWNNQSADPSGIPERMTRRGDFIQR